MKFFVVVLSFVMAVGSAFADDGFLSKLDSELRLGVKLDDEAGREGDPGIGFEVGFGQSLHALDSVSLNLGHEDNDGDDFTQLLLLLEEHYDIGMPLMPYAGAGFGYGWLGIDDVRDRDSWLLRFDLGVRLLMSENVSLSAALEFSWSDEEVFQEDSKVEDKNIELGIGFRYHW